MEKSKLLIAMGMMTVFGIAFFAIGMANLDRFPNHALAQSWDQLWKEHTLFAWAATLYFFAMVLCDLWVMASVFFLAPKKK
jgi:hypothetical protein